MLRNSDRLNDCDPDLITLVMAVGNQRNVVLIQGARALSDELRDINTGKSSLKNPMDSKHVTDSVMRPLALAVDLAPDPVDWKDIPAFEDLGQFVKNLAATLGIAITWGGDWIHFKDYDHFELVHAHAETV